MMSGFLFDQLIDVQTRVTTTSQTIIDLIYSTDIENHSLNGVLKTSFSDHYMIFTVYGDADITQKENIIEWRDFKGFELAEFNFLLSQVHFEEVYQCKDVNCAWDIWYNPILKIVNMCAPYKRKRVRNNPCPWVTGDVIKLMNTRDYLHDKAIQLSSSDFWEQYKKCRNLITRELKNLKKSYITSLLNDKSGNANALWDVMRRLTKKSQSKNIILNVNDVEISDFEGGC